MSFYFELKPEDREKAIRYLLTKIPNEIWNDIKKSIDESGDAWYSEEHFGIGLYVRNLLLKGNFDINGIFMDTYWHELIEEAIKRKYGSFNPE